MSVGGPLFLKQAGLVCRSDNQLGFQYRTFSAFTTKRSKGTSVRTSVHGNVAGNTTRLQVVWNCNWEFPGSQSNCSSNLTPGCKSPLHSNPCLPPNWKDTEAFHKFNRNVGVEPPLKPEMDVWGLGRASRGQEEWASRWGPAVDPGPPACSAHTSQDQARCACASGLTMMAG